ncbi:nucleotidyltransferase family protein [Sciscionella marina]|uniref:nucleotidyltransferase family protein n=1 Tax=Sciscionella marina TaxID=508770 RepID=UPI000366421A|nr:nucleotidyltransferase family protein [Sciscionella marina]
MFVTGLVLAAGSSRRLGHPKQLLPYRGATLLDATMDTARRCAFGQLLVTLGGAAEGVRARVDLSGARIVEVPDHRHGCGNSLRQAIPAVDPRAEGLVLLPGDQPGIRPETVRELLRAAGASPAGVCRYTDGVGHPFWFHAELFRELAALHGDKAVWSLLERTPEVVELAVETTVPPDVDTWEDYQMLLAETGVRG